MASPGSTVILQEQLEELGLGRRPSILYRVFRVFRFATGFLVRHLASGNEEYFYDAPAVVRYMRRRR